MIIQKKTLLEIIENYYYSKRLSVSKEEKKNDIITYREESNKNDD